MPNSATFLHVTDAHLTSAGTSFPWDDHKVDVPGIQQDTREGVLDLTFGRLGERLANEGRRLDGVIFSGDAQDRGRPGGPRVLLDLIIKHFARFGVTAANIVAVPGNHDVPRGSAPSSIERYQAFVEVWRKAGCVTPWLDGVDADAATAGLHRLVSQDSTWAVYPINTCNWSHVSTTLRETLGSTWEELPALLAGGDTHEERRFRQQLDKLAQYDMARVSSRQLEVLRSLIEGAPGQAAGRQLRIAVLHHHLRAPSLREELKPFADISNLEQVRGFLRDRNIAVVVHGHKHQHATQFEHIYDQDGVNDHRVLVVSGATFEPQAETDAVRLITISGIPNYPSTTIERFSLARGGIDLPALPKITRRLWSSNVVAGAPIVIQGSDISEVYDRVCEVATTDAANGILIAHLDLPLEVNRELPLPANYPLPELMAHAERARWLKELVEWWQLRRSGFEHRMPFAHGSRLRRYGGKIDQIDRVTKLLKTKASTRALAILIDPFRDFTPDGLNEEFASFCLVEFKRRELDGARCAIDAIGFYRAQEFMRWWPINVAEMRYLQWEICSALGFMPGRITTIAGDARTYSRSPMQVTMPIVDRWLDQAPQRLYLLANALAQKSVRDGPQREAVRGWKRALVDLEAAATEYNPDGLPIAIDGLKILASYLEAGDEGNDPQLTTFFRTLQRLSHDNERFERGARTRADFDAWAPNALAAIAELLTLTEARIGTV